MLYAMRQMSDPASDNTPWFSKDKFQSVLQVGPVVVGFFTLLAIIVGYVNTQNNRIEDEHKAIVSQLQTMQVDSSNRNRLLLYFLREICIGVKDTPTAREKCNPPPNTFQNSATGAALTMAQIEDPLN